MICILDILKEETGLFKDKSCDCDNTNKCDYCIQKSKFKLNNNKLTKSVFGWEKDCKLELDESFKNKKDTIIYKVGLKLIHPSNDNIWIFKCLRIKNNKIFYLVCSEDKTFELHDLNSLNQWLISSNYDGRVITKLDF